jgi:3-(methylthio)propanoyl-CoA dehydrogenase
LKQKLIDARRNIEAVVQEIKPKGNSYLDLCARKLVDGAITIVVGHLLLGQAAANDRKKRVVRRYLQRDLPVLASNIEQIRAGDTTPVDEYALLAGPVPAA